MQNGPLLTSLVIEFVTIIVFIYFIDRLKKADHKSKKSSLTIGFEHFKRKKVLSNSLIIIWIAFVAFFLVIYGTLFNAFKENYIDIFYLISKLVLLIFIVYLIQITKYHNS